MTIEQNKELCPKCGKNLARRQMCPRCGKINILRCNDCRKESSRKIEACVFCDTILL